MVRVVKEKIEKRSPWMDSYFIIIVKVEAKLDYFPKLTVILDMVVIITTVNTGACSFRSLVTGCPSFKSRFIYENRLMA